MCIPYSIAFDPADRYAYITSGASETDPSHGIYGGATDVAGNLTNVPGSPLVAFSFFGAVEPSQSKFFVDLVGEQNAAMLTSFSIDPTTGALSQISSPGVALNATIPIKLVIAAPPTG